MAENDNNLKPPGAGSVRLEGKFYSINRLIEGVQQVSSGSVRQHKFFALVLFCIFYGSTGLLEASPASWLGLFFALLTHEAGHFIGMILVGWKQSRLVVSAFLIPNACGEEGLSAGRKAVVALAGPAVGLLAGLLSLAMINDSTGAFFICFMRASLFLSAINLIPILPFDAGEMVEHLLLIRFPKFELGYFIASGVFLFIFFYGYYCTQERVMMTIVSCAVATAQFHSVKKVDNMASMIRLLRKNGDNEKECYSPSAIQRMQFCLACFDTQDENSVVQILREVWDRAREVPSTFRETGMVLVIYALFVIVCATTPAVWEMIELMK